MTKKKKKIVFVVVFILAVIIGIFLFTDIYLLFLRPLDVGKEIDKDYGDCILVLGGGLKSGYHIGYSTEERLLQAVRFYRQKKRVVYISDGSLYRGSPAVNKVIDFLLQQGLEPAHIKYEGKSQTTYDNCLFAQKLLQDKQCRQVIICTSPYHQLRAVMILQHLGVENFQMAPMVKSEIYQSAGIGQRLRNIKLIFREYFAIVKFKLFKN